MDLAINGSLALADVPMLERAGRAAALGYETMESWWPFARQEPTHKERADLLCAVRDVGVTTVLLNFPGGGASVDDRGLLCVPGRQADFLSSARTAIAIGQELGVTRYNPMVGNATCPWSSDSAEFAVALDNLVRVAPIVADSGAELVIEPLSGFPHAAVTSFERARELVLAARDEGAANVGILLDLFHLAVLNDPVLPSLDVDVDLISHVQLADSPGRGWPGTGGLPLAGWIAKLWGLGYRGAFGLECRGEPLPADETASLLERP